MALAGFRVTDARAAVADYTSFYGYEDTYLVFRASETSSNSGSSDFYLRPFQWEVYVVIAGCMVCVLLLLLLSRYAAWYTQTQDSVRSRPDVAHWLMEDTEALFAGLLNRSHGVKEAPPPAGQVMAVTWLYVSVVLMTGVYSSQLTASLTVREEAPPFSSLQELVTQDTYTWGVSSGTALQTMIRTSNNDIYRQLYQGVIRFTKADPDVLSTSSKTQFDRVLKGHYAYLVGEEKKVFYMQSLHCHLSAIKVPGLSKGAVFYLQKHSPYTSMISEALSRMQETGVVAHILQKWTPEPKRCEVPDSTSAIGLEQAKTAFYVVGAGMGLALLSFLLEVWCGQKGGVKAKV